MYLTPIQSEEWHSCLERLPETMRDVHFLPGMMVPYEATGMGRGFLYIEEKKKDKFVFWPVLQCQDGVSRHPYNFGGPVGNTSVQMCPVNECILNPFLHTTQNKMLSGMAEYVKDVVWVDLTTPAKFRGTSRRLADKCQAEVKVTGLLGIDELADLYVESMERKHAAEHWRFTKSWFQALQLSMLGHVTILLAYADGKTVAGCLLLHGYGTCYYHFAASSPDAPKGTSHRMVITAIEWAKKTGHERFHLGGGLQPDDGLFTFKSGFSDLRLPVYRYVA
jgi:hypothetical protein